MCLRRMVGICHCCCCEDVFVKAVAAGEEEVVVVVVVEEEEEGVEVEVDVVGGREKRRWRGIE